MRTPRADILAALDRMSDDELTELLALAQRIEQRRTAPPLLERLAADPSFRIPQPEHRTFARFTPIDATGLPASEILVRDRR